MKRLLLGIWAVLLLAGCRERIPEKCEQYYETEQIPELSQTEYNDCHSVLLNYAYFVRWNDMDAYLEHYPNPFESKIGDTIKMCGFITHSYGEPIEQYGDYWSCWMRDDSIAAMDPNNYSAGIVMIQGDDASILDGVDMTKKCYIIGVTTYQRLIPYVDSPADPCDCWNLSPVLFTLEINN